MIRPLIVELSVGVEDRPSVTIETAKDEVDVRFGIRINGEYHPFRIQILQCGNEAREQVCTDDSH